MNQKSKIIKLYQKEKIARTFDEERREFSYQKYKHSIETNILKKILKSKDNQTFKVLDVACGTGRMLSEVFYANPNIEYTGVDMSLSMTKFLKERAKAIGKEEKVNLLIADATKLPFKDNTFDVAFTYHLTWHLPQKEQLKMMKELERVTKKGGYFVFDILNQDFLYEKIKSKKIEGIYKMRFREIKKAMIGKDIKIEKINDAHIENSALYWFFNLINHVRMFLPKSFYHMLYLVIKK